MRAAVPHSGESVQARWAAIRRTAARGFTLVEMTIVVAIFAIAASVMVMGTSNLTLADLRASASKLSGVVRSVYDEAALTGQTYRLLLDFDSKVIKVASTEQVLNLEPDSNVLAQASRVKSNLGAISALADEIAADMDLSGNRENMPPPALSALMGVNNLAGSNSMAADGGFTGERVVLELDDDVKLMDVWIQGMDKPAAEGHVYLYFFPHGYTQDALIHLADTHGNVFTVKIYALTGHTRIIGEYVEPPK